jgi:glutaredoxin
MSQPDVKIYSLSTCSHCKATKKFLGECTIKYEFIEVDKLEGAERKAIIEDVKKFNPRCSFPTIIIGETVIVGYKEKDIREALGME